MKNNSFWLLVSALAGLVGLFFVGLLVVVAGGVWMLRPQVLGSGHSRTYQESLAEVMTGQSTIEPLGGIEIRPGRILREVREPVEGLTRTEVKYEIHGPRMNATVTAHAFEDEAEVLGYQKFVVQFADGTQLAMRRGATTLEKAKIEAAKPKPKRSGLRL